MPRDYFRECGDAIQRELDEILSAHKFLGLSLKVLSKSGPVLASVASEKELRELLEGFRESNVNELTLLYQALYVQVWSAFEGFMRSVLVAYLETLASHKSDFETLEKYGLGRRNLEYTGRVLQFIRDSRERFSIDFF